MFRFAYGESKVAKHSHHNYMKQRDGEPKIRTFGSAGNPARRPESLKDMGQSRACFDGDQEYELRDISEHISTGIMVTRQVDLIVDRLRDDL